MADYHWNEQPADLLALLDNSASLPPLDGFEASSFAAPAPLSDIFTSLEAPAAAAAAVDTHTPPGMLHDLQVPDLAPPAANHFEATHPPPHVVQSYGANIMAEVPPVNDPLMVPPSSDGSVDGEINSERDFSAPAPQTPDGAASLETIPGVSASISSAASDVTAGVSAVEEAKKAAEDFANSKVSERKRKLNRDDGDGKRRKGNDGQLLNSDDDDDAPEKVSHRKYQKRLQKNRDSAYVSRIRRREYTKRLEDGLNRVEKEKNELQSRYDALHRKFEVVFAELKTLKEATAARFGAMSKALAVPVGAARQTAKPKNAGAIVTTMFMCALIFGFMVPESLTSRSPFTATPGGAALAHGVKAEPKFVHLDDNKKGRVWSGNDPMMPAPPPIHWKLYGGDNMLRSLTSNVTTIFGNENGAEMLSMIQSKVRRGVVDESTLKDVAKRAQKLVDNMNSAVVKRTLPSRRSKMFLKVLRKLATLADECFTKELVALLTIRLHPVGARALKK